MTSQTLELVTEDTATVSEENKVSFRKPADKSTITWPVALFLVAVHIIALGAFFTFSWKALFLCLFLHWVTGGLGITLAYHRLLTHRSFKTPKIVEYFLAMMGNLACQSGPIEWVTAHRLHHAYSDQVGDPHTPKDGFFWSHMGWCMVENKVVQNREVQARVSPDLARDPFMVMLDRTHIFWTILLATGLYAWGGWPFVIWGIFVRLVLVYHCTWFVNSAAHVWGYKTYKANDDSRNLWWVALITYGEGWHNNHHAFQYSARHGLKWWEFDSTYLMVQILKFFRLASAVKLPPERLLTEKSFK